MEMDDSIKVAIRVRPLIQRENGQSKLWDVVDACKVVPVGNGKPYIFDRVFDQNENTEELFTEIAEPIVQGAMEGYNGTIFAYGQTASGKTYTMMGDDQNPGVIPLCAKAIFNYIENTPNREFLIRISYIEIYNEIVGDLFGDVSKELGIREDRGSVYVCNLKEEMVSSAVHIVRFLKMAEANRHVGSTNMNERSSRSHTIFRVIIESKERDDSRRSIDGAVNVSHLNLVDLAGSENAKQTGATGARLREGAYINTSLLSLSQVIFQLSEKAKFVSYRNSKLTRILQNSLGGNSRTAIICNVTVVSHDETISTLRFATSAKSIINHATVNEVVSDETMLKRCKMQLAQLKTELEQMKATDVGELQMRLAEKERLQFDQEDKIRKLTQFICVSSTRGGEPERRTRNKRRETWCPGNVTRPVELSPLPRAIPTIPEEVSVFPAGTSFIHIEENIEEPLSLHNNHVKILTPEKTAEVQVTDEEKIKLNEELKAVNMKAVSLENEKVNLNKELKKMSDRNRRLIEENRRYDKELKELEEFRLMDADYLNASIMEKKQNHSDDLAAQVDGLKKTAADSEFMIIESQKKLALTESRNHQLTKEMEDLQAYLKRLEMDKLDFDSYLEIERQKHKRRESELAEQLSVAYTENQTLHTNTTSSSHLASSSDQANERLSKLEEQLRPLQIEKDEIQEQMHKSVVTHQIELERQQEELKQARSALEEHQRLQADMEQWQVEKVKLQESNVLLEERVEEMKICFSDYEVELNEERRKCEEAEAKLVQAELLLEEQKKKESEFHLERENENHKSEADVTDDITVGGLDFPLPITPSQKPTDLSDELLSQLQDQLIRSEKEKETLEDKLLESATSHELQMKELEDKWKLSNSRANDSERVNETTKTLKEYEDKFAQTEDDKQGSVSSDVEHQDIKTEMENLMQNQRELEESKAMLETAVADLEFSNAEFEEQLILEKEKRENLEIKIQEYEEQLAQHVDLKQCVTVTTEDFQKALDEIDLLKNEKEKLEESKAIIESTVAEMKFTRAGLEDDITEETEKRENLEKELQECKQQLKELDDLKQSATISGDIQEALDEVENLKIEKQKLEDGKLLVESSLAEMKFTMAGLEEEIAEEKEKRADLEKNLIEYKQQLEELDDLKQSATISGDIQEALDEVENLKIEKQKLEDGKLLVESSLAEMKFTMAGLEEEIAEEKEKRADLEKNLIEYKQQLEELDDLKQSATISGDIQEALDEVENLKIEKQKLEDGKLLVESSLAEIKFTMAGLEEEIAEEKEKRADLEKNLIEYKQQLEELDDLKQSATISGGIQEALDEVENLKIEKQKLEDGKLLVESSLAEMKFTMAGLEEEIAEEKEKRADLEKNLIEYKQQLEELGDLKQSATISGDIQEALDEVENLKIEKQKLEDGKLLVESSLAEMKFTMAGLEEEIAEEKEKRADLEKNLIEYKQQLEELGDLKQSATISGDIQEALDEVENLKIEKQKLEDKKLLVESSLAEMKFTMAGHEEEIAVEKEKRADLEKNLIEYKQQLEELGDLKQSATISGDIQEALDEVENLKIEKQKLEDDKLLVESSLAEMKFTMAGLEEEIAEEKEKRADLENNLIEYKQKLEIVEQGEPCPTINEDYHKALDMVQVLRQEKEQVEESKFEIETLVEELKLATASYEHELILQKEKIEDLERKQREYEDQLAERETDLKRYIASNEEYLSAIEDLRGEKQILEETKAILETTVAEMKFSIVGFQEEIEEEKEKREYLEKKQREATEQHQQNLDDVLDQRFEAEEKIEKIHEEYVHSIKIELQQREIEAEKAISEVSKLRDELESTKESLKAVEAKARELQDVESLYEHQLVDLREKCDSAEGIYETKQQELLDKLNDMEVKILDLEETKQLLEECLKESEKELRDLRKKDCEDKEQTEKSRQDSITISQAESDKCKLEASRAAATVHQLTDELEKTKSNLEAELEDSRIALSTTMFADELGLIKSELQAAHDLIEKLKEKEAIYTSFSSNRDGHHESEEKLKEENLYLLEKLKASDIELTNLRETMDLQNQMHEEKVRTLEAELQELAKCAHSSGMHEELEGLRSKLKDAEAKLTSSKETEDLYLAAMKEHDDELEDLNDRFFDEKEKLEEMHNEVVEKLKGDIIAKELSMVEASEKLTQVMEEFEKVNAANEAAENQIKKLKEDLELYDSCTREHDQELRNLNDEFFDEKEKIEQTHAELVEKLKADIEVQQLAVKEADEKVAALTNQLEKTKDGQKEDLKKRPSEDSTDTATLRRTNVDLKMRLAGLEWELAKAADPYRQKIRDLNEEVEYQTNKNRELKDRLRIATQVQLGESVCIKPSAPSQGAAATLDELPCEIQLKMGTLAREKKRLQERLDRRQEVIEEHTKKEEEFMAQITDLQKQIEKFKSYYKKQLNGDERAALRDMVNDTENIDETEGATAGKPEDFSMKSLFPSYQPDSDKSAVDQCPTQ